MTLRISPKFLLARFRVRRAAMTLVEVAMALGLTSFALLAVTGLLPVSLNVMRDASRKTVEAQILTSIESELLTAQFDWLDTDRQFFFDHSGVSVSESDNVYYRVSVSKVLARYPGVPADIERALKAVDIEIEAGPLKGAAGNGLSRHTLYVGRNGS